ncbi:hypothetical protein Tco_1198266, partial [Tanacetum coccineum]
MIRSFTMMSEDSSAAGTDNRPPMLEENNYESWKICIERYIKGKTHENAYDSDVDDEPNAATAF